MLILTTHLSVIAPNNVTTSLTKMYPSQYDNKLEVKHLLKNYKIRCKSFAWKPAMILEPAIMEYKQ